MGDEFDDHCAHLTGALRLALRRLAAGGPDHRRIGPPCQRKLTRLDDAGALFNRNVVIRARPGLECITQSDDQAVAHIRPEGRTFKERIHSRKG